MTDVVQKFRSLEDSLDEVLFERESEVHSAVLALVSRRHLFMVGPPGIAKSMIVNELCKRIDFEGHEDAYFKHLLTKFTVPEELFGPPDFALMKDEGIYKRRVEGYLPTAIIAFLDEIFKASSAILNSLLTAINEGEFHNYDDDPSIPLRSVFAASNEIPTTSELEALADRLHFWHNVEPITDPSNFAQMLTLVPQDVEPIVSLEDIDQANSEVPRVAVPDQVINVLIDLASALRSEGITVSDRRFNQSMDIIRAEAWLDGRDVADIIDTKPLQHVMWRDPQQISTVRKLVLNLADPLERDILDLRENLEDAYQEYLRSSSDVQANALKAKAALEAYEKFTKAKEEFVELRKREKASGRKSKHLAALRIRLKTIGKEIHEDGLQSKTASKALNPSEGLED